MEWSLGAIARYAKTYIPDTTPGPENPALALVSFRQVGTTGRERIVLRGARGRGLCERPNVSK
jgi:hypothetical protein